MKNFLKIIFLLLLFSNSTQILANRITKIACIGNSITQGVGVTDRTNDGYVGVLSSMLGNDYVVRNFGKSGRTILSKGDLPYYKTKQYQNALSFEPDIVTIKFGTNDTKPKNWIHKSDFESDMRNMITSFQELPSHPKIFLCLPLAAFRTDWGINDSIIVNGVIPIIKKISKELNIEIIDLHTPFIGHLEWTKDKIHPNERGCTEIARIIYKHITGKKTKYQHSIKIRGDKKDWNGFDEYSFVFNGIQANVVSPHKTAKGNPWIWRPTFYGQDISVDLKLLELGYHLAFYNLSDSLKKSNSLEYGKSFYDLMVNNYLMNPKVVLEGISDGGYYVFNWAAHYPSEVGCIYVNDPLCFIENLSPKVDNSDKTLIKAKISEVEVSDNIKEPISGIQSLIDHKVPIIACCSLDNNAIPYNDNFKILGNELLKSCGKVETILKKNRGNNRNNLFDPDKITSKIIKYNHLKK